MSQQRFCATHQWAQRMDEKRVQVGISQHAETALGDIVYVELPEAGKVVAAGDVIGGIESVKAASEIQSPVSGRLVASNAALDTAPELLNDAPLTTWVYELECDPAVLDEEWQDLLDGESYERILHDS